MVYLHNSNFVGFLHPIFNNNCLQVILLLHMFVSCDSGPDFALIVVQKLYRDSYKLLTKEFVASKLFMSI